MWAPLLEAQGILGGEKSLEAYLAYCGVCSLQELVELDDDQQLTLDVAARDERAA